MGRMYVLSGENLTLSTGSVLAAIRPAAADAAGSILSIKRIEVSQSGTANLAQVRLAFGERDTAGTLTMTSQAPNPLGALGAPASGITGSTAPAGTAARSGINSSADSGGTYTNTYPVATANINGWLWKPDPQEELLVTPGRVFVLRFLTAPGTTTGWTFAITFEEKV